MDVQRDAIDLFAIELPHVINPFIQPARGVDGGVGVQTATTNLLGRDFLQAGTGCAVLHLCADRHVGHP
ncbi:hypothetical protein D3C84_1283420 [compost metagenome]